MAKKYIQLGKTNAENVTNINDNFTELYRNTNSIFDDVQQLQEDVADIQTELSNINTWQASVDTALADTGWINLNLNSGWSCPYNTDIAKYRKIGNVVYLRGLLVGTASASNVIATLPDGYRPSGHFERFACPHQQINYVNIEVGYTGEIKDYTKVSDREFISLYGINFIV